MSLTLEALRPCLEGIVPSQLATCSADGIPNIAWISQVDYVNGEHVALSFQFFNKTRENILACPYALTTVIHPYTGQVFQLTMCYLRTETDGQVFERMKARLAGIASHTGMAGIFILRGADIYRVEKIVELPCKRLPEALPPKMLAPAMRSASQRMAAADDLESLLDATLTGLVEDFNISHSMFLMWDTCCGKLITLASRGYETSGVGSEIGLHEGVIGVAAAQRTPIRITHMTNEYRYGRVIREQALELGLEQHIGEEIPFPGLAQPGSQLAVPVIAAGRLIGVLHVESEEDNRFTYDHEDVLVMLATQLGLSMALLTHAVASAAPTLHRQEIAPISRKTLQVRYFACNDSIFLGDEYLIKGVAGAICWRLLQEYVASGRTEFSNRELRLDPNLGLPDIVDNLEARLVLLARRLAERDRDICIKKTGRGRFRLCIGCEVQLSEAASNK